MSRQTRLDRVECHLNPKQLVIAEVRDSRRKYRYFMECGRAMAKLGLPMPTLMDRIEASVLATAKGLDRTTQRQMLREAQREGLFLDRLANYCAGHVVDHQRETDLMTAYLYTLCVMLADHAGELDDELMGKWLAAVQRERADIMELRAAIALIEREYFDGAGILFSASRENLDKNLAELTRLLDLHKKWLARVREILEETSKVTKEERAQLEHFLASLAVKEDPTDRDLEAAARRRAQQMVSLVRVTVLDDFGDKERATRLVAALVLKEG